MKTGTPTTLALAALVLACAPSAELISPEALLVRPADRQTLILDVRTPEEYAGGHVPGAINIPYDQVSSRLAELDPHRGSDVVIYCETGGRAGKAAVTQISECLWGQLEAVTGVGA